MMAEIRRVGVVGAGTMGNGIAHVFARSGFPVVLADVDQPALDRGFSTIEKNLAREVAKGKLAQTAADAARARVTGTLDRKALTGCDLVVEAATERFAVKQSLFQELDGQLGADAILASNTSSISITKLAATTKRPDRVIGMHFFNPVPVMQLVEVIRGLATSDATTARVLEWSKAVDLPEETGKTPEARDMGVPDLYPWGNSWPPPNGAGNYTGEETGSDMAIKGYDDGFAWTSPVGSFARNKYGLYDMGGNVWQWCMDGWMPRWACCLKGMERVILCHYLQQKVVCFYMAI